MQPPPTRREIVAMLKYWQNAIVIAESRLKCCHKHRNEWETKLLEFDVANIAADIGR